MLCKNRITVIGFLGQHAETRSTPNDTAYTRFSLATSVSWKDKHSDDYETRTEWHRVISWNKLGVWAGALQKGAYVEVEGELRYREFTPAESARSVRVAEIYANSILALDRSDKQPAAEESVLLQNIVQNWPRKESRELARGSRDIDKSLPIIVGKKRVDSDWAQQIGEIAVEGRLQRVNLIGEPRSISAVRIARIITTVTLVGGI